MYNLVQIKDMVRELRTNVSALMARNAELTEKVKDLSYQIKLLREMLKRRTK